MLNNDVLRRIRYVFKLNEAKIVSIFALADSMVTAPQVTAWLKKDDDPAYIKCHDKEFATFLNGFINLKRGKKDGDQPLPENILTNNIVFRKLTIALNLKSEDVLEMMDLAEFSISKHELSAFFRKKSHKHYRECKDQILRNFLKGLQVKHLDK